MNFMLDTNICVAMIRYRPVSLLHRMTACEPGTLWVSSITTSELFHGAEKSARPVENRAALTQFLLPLVVVDYDEAASRIYGRLRTELERAGTPTGSMDMLIAAHALSLDVTLVTNNSREFRRVKGLALEDWIGKSRK